MDSGNNREKKEEKRIERSEKSVSVTPPPSSSAKSSRASQTTSPLSGVLLRDQESKMFPKKPSATPPSISSSKAGTTTTTTTSTTPSSSSTSSSRSSQLAKKNNKTASLSSSTSSTSTTPLPSTTTTTSTTSLSSTSTTTSTTPTPTHTAFPLDSEISKLPRAPSKSRPTLSHAHSSQSTSSPLHTHIPHSHSHHSSSIRTSSELPKPELTKTDSIRLPTDHSSSKTSTTRRPQGSSSIPKYQYVSPLRTPPEHRMSGELVSNTITSSHSTKTTSGQIRTPSAIPFELPRHIRDIPIAEEQKETTTPPAYKPKSQSTAKRSPPHTVHTKQPEMRELSSSSLTNNNNNNNHVTIPTTVTTTTVIRDPASSTGPRFLDIRSESDSSSEEDEMYEDDDSDSGLDVDENLPLSGGLRDLSDADIAFLLQGIEARKALRRLQRHHNQFANLLTMGIEHRRRSPVYLNTNVTFIPQERPDLSYESLVQLEDVVCGVPQEIINSLPKSIFQKDASKSDEAFTPFSGASTECSICLTEWEDGDVIMTLPCVHNFHFECGSKWLNFKKTCPNCKDEVCA